MTIFGPAQPDRFRDAVVAAALYVSNWQLIFQHVSYFARFGPPEPLGHLWSLGGRGAVLHPLAAPAAARRAPDPGAPGAPVGIRPRLAVADAGASPPPRRSQMAVLYHPSFDPSRIYYGTDTRAFELLVGAALAMVWPSRRLQPRTSPRGARRCIDGAGVVGLRRDRAADLAHEPVLALPLPGRLGAALDRDRAARRRARPSRQPARARLGWRPLRWIGVRSYGIYLWHLPIIVADHAEPARTAPSLGARRAPGRRRPSGSRRSPGASSRSRSATARSGASGSGCARSGWRPEAISRQRPARGRRARRRVARRAIVGAGRGGTRSRAEPPRGRRRAPSPRRLRRRGSHGDRRRRGTGDPRHELLPRGRPHRRLDLGGADLDRLPARTRSDRIEAQYARVGATTSDFSISGARSIVETYEGEPNAYEVGAGLEGRRLQGLLGLRPRNQRHRERLRRRQRRPARHGSKR